MNYFFDKLNFLDIAITKNDVSDISLNKIANIIKNEKLKEYFFRNITNNIWVKPLYKRNYFNKPPIRKISSHGITDPAWVESQYLARIKEYDVELIGLVELIILSWETDNENVHEDILDIVMNLPIGNVSRLLDNEILWIKNTSTFHMLLPYKYEKVIQFLSNNGLDCHALEIAKSLLELKPDSKTDKKEISKQFVFPPTPETKFDRHHYQEILKNTIPLIFHNNQIITIDFLCKLLNRWIELSKKKKASERHDDISHIWCNTIDSVDEDKSYSISNAIVGSIKNISIDFLEKDQNNLIEVIKVFENYTWGIFKRFSMFILKNFPNSKYIKKYLVDYKYFSDILVHNEYVLLLKSRFSDLSIEDQTKILGWIDKGPDIDIIKKNYKEWQKKSITITELEDRIIDWKKKKFLPISNSLNKKMKEKYHQYIKPEIIVRDDDVIIKRSSGAVSWGPTSPYSEDDLKELPIKQIITKLKTVKYQRGHMDPSPEGLGRILTGLVKNRARELSREAELFINLKANYVRGFITGINEYIKTNNDVYWLPIIRLCNWVLQQPYKIEDEDQANPNLMDYDKTWSWTRKSIADLLGTGLSGGSKEIPFQYRLNIWELLSILIEDTDPTIERENESLNQNWDPFTDSINCTRGESMHSLIQYGLWCKRSIELKRKKQFSFMDAKELELKLNLHLDHRHEKSLAIHSVYGHWFPWLLLLDKKWAIRNSDKIFPLEINKITYWKSAWQGYINFRSPYNNVLKYLNKSYLYAINQTHNYDEDDDRNFPENSFKHLVEHLLIYYWRRKLDLSKNGTIAKFFQLAPQKLRAFAIRFAGFSLRDNPGPVEDKFIKPIEELWEWRIINFENSDTRNEYYDELANFGYWFSSGKLDSDWSLNQLEYVINNCNKLEDRKGVIKQLSIEVKKNKSKTLNICNLILNLDLQPWEINSWDEYLREIIKNINEFGSKKDKENGLYLINNLGLLGQYQYKDIWKLMRSN